MILRVILNKTVAQKFCYCTSSTSNNKKIYSKTVLLPKTKFPLRLENEKLTERDKNIYTAAKFEELYVWQRANLSEPEFVLHDGPPYANGNLHMGHAINKVLKDTILRYKILNGNKVNYVPGWDCHGLPIELKATSNTENLDATEIRNKARNFATKNVEKQMAGFKSWGIIGDWANHYRTYNPDYVKSQLRVFYKLYAKGLIYRDFKPIYWSPSSRTALAEAELKYNENHKSPSLYFRVKLKNIPNIDFINKKNVYAVIWTTTPWTLPSNQAICFNEKLAYVFVKKADPEDTDVYLMASELLDDVSKTLNTEFQLLGVTSGEMLTNSTYVHPIYSEKICNFINASHVNASKGTGLVHTAPAHGPDDFLVAINNKMSIEDLVDEKGCYKNEVGDILKGKFVLSDGTDTVLQLIKNDLMHLGELTHSYPYDWRTNKPVILRASLQWFIDTELIKDKAIELLENVDIIPKVNSEKYKKILINQIKKRPYWCISRQRKWGVPIPVFYNKTNSEIIIREDIIHHHCNLIDKYGTDFWWKLNLEALLPKEINNEYSIENIVKGQDILDIWFDSGISWSKVLEGRKVANMYLEGVDQFNGWFHSSLMTSVALREKAPFENIYVHGFAVDENGIKMSKSLGNVIDPNEIVRGGKKNKPYGIDVLRWWVICHANQDSVAHVSKNVLQSSADEIQKIRNVLRFALGSLNDYNYETEDYNNLSLIDKYMLHLLYNFHIQTKENIDNYQFHKIGFALIHLLTNPVSALYYTAIKDTLYCDLPDSITRKCTIYVLFQIFEIVTQAIAPIVPHLVEEMFLFLPQQDGNTYFTSKHDQPSEHWHNSKIEAIMNLILSIKKSINKEATSTNNIDVDLVLSEKILKEVKETINVSDLECQLIDILQVSQVKVRSSMDKSEDYKIDLKTSNLNPCPRCRRVHSISSNDLCKRCDNIINIKNNKAVQN